MITEQDAARFLNRKVVVNLNTNERDSDGELLFTTLEGKVLAVSDAGIILRISRGGPQIINLRDIIDIEGIENRKVIVRYLRVIGLEESMKQHLADRHGILVSVLNAVDERVAREMHDGIKHDDLGHRHGVAPARGNTDAVSAAAAIQMLDDVA